MLTFSLPHKIHRFFTEPLSPIIWGYFRIAIALFCLVEYTLIAPDLVLLFSKNGLVPWQIGDNLVATYLPTIGKLEQFFGNGLLSSKEWLWLCYSLFMLSLVGLLMGWQTRTMAISAWLMHLIFFQTAHLCAYGVESFTSIALFYSIFAPIEQAISIDSWRKAHPAPPSSWARISLRVLQIHLCVVYLASGLEKSMGAEWWNGNAIWYALNEEQFRQFDMSWLAQVPFISKILGWGTLMIEIGYIFFIWFPRMRRFWLSLTLSLHLGIAIFMGLHLFATVMILLNLFAWLEMTPSVKKQFKTSILLQDMA